MSLQDAQQVLADPKPASAKSGQAALENWQRRAEAARVARQADPAVEATHQLVDVDTNSESRYQKRTSLIGFLLGIEQYAKANPERDLLVQDTVISPGKRALFAAGLALDMAIGGEFQRSNRYISQAKSLSSQAGPDELESLPNDPYLQLLRAEAELEARRGNLLKALEISQSMVDRAQLTLGTPNLSNSRRQAASNAIFAQSWNHGLYLGRLGRRDEALAFIENIKRKANDWLGGRPSLLQIATLEYGRARALASSGAYEEALQANSAAFGAFSASKTPNSNNQHALAHRLQSRILLGLNRLPESCAAASVVHSARLANDLFAKNTSELEDLSMMALCDGKHEVAVEKAQANSNSYARWQGYGSSQFKTANALEVLVRLQSKSGELPEKFISDFVKGLTSTSTQWVDSTQRAEEVESAALELILEKLIDRPAWAASVFQLAEVLRADASQGALLTGAAKMAENSVELRALLDKERAATEALTEHRSGAAVLLTRNERVATGQNDPLIQKRQQNQLDEKLKALNEAESRLANIRQQIAVQFPKYQELLSPRIPDIASISKLLKPHEAYVNFFPGRLSGYAILIQPDAKVSAWRVPMTRAETAANTNDYRKFFDTGLPPIKGDDLRQMNIAAGTNLYAAWLEPLVRQIGQNKTVFVAASGPLSAVPWPALPQTQMGVLGQPMRWAVESSDIVMMPSASSFVMTRTLKRTLKADQFLAYADPAFGSNADASRLSASDRRSSSQVRSNATPTNTFDYQKINPLPETLDEVRAIAAAFGESKSTVVSGKDASRSRVLADKLLQAKVLTFATHGVVPGEIPGYLNFGLAMAYEGKGLPDSILSVDDVINLQLNADVILLSACNTGLARGGVGDSVSTLARGFFIAGAQSLMVTAWAVDSLSAKALTVTAFKEWKTKSVSTATALGNAQRQMLRGEQGDAYRHPYHWGAYFLVGNPVVSDASTH